MASTTTSEGDDYSEAAATDETHETHETDAAVAPCRKCEQPIPTDVETCPECGFNFGNTIAGLGVAIGAVGGLLTLLIVTAVIGIPMVLVAIPVIAYGIMTSKPAADVSDVDNREDES